MADSEGMDERSRFSQLSYEVVGACIEVHQHLGPGLLESTYHRCLAHEEGLLVNFDVPVLRDGVRHLKRAPR